jgi:prepilin-type processing-associated H-X9-DG protein
LVGVSLAQIGDPSGTMMHVDATLGGAPPATYNYAWSGITNVYVDATGSTFRVDCRHGSASAALGYTNKDGIANMNYCDGHAKGLPYGKIPKTNTGLWTLLDTD